MRILKYLKYLIVAVLFFGTGMCLGLLFSKKYLDYINSENTSKLYSKISGNADLSDNACKDKISSLKKENIIQMSIINKQDVTKSYLDYVYSVFAIADLEWAGISKSHDDALYIIDKIETGSRKSLLKINVDDCYDPSFCVLNKSEMQSNR